VRTLVSPSGKIEVKWPWRLGGRWEIKIAGRDWIDGIRWPGTRRSRWFIWSLDASADVMAEPPTPRVTEAEEFEQLSREVGKPMPDDNPLGLRDGIPPTDAALDSAKALGWSERGD
jgi:hypothetical protein